MIDIVGLQISTAEFLWTVLSFFLFMFLLKKVLYEPILKVMDSRNAAVKEALDEGKNAQRVLEESRAGFALELSAKGSDARAIVSDAKAQAEREKSAVLADAHTQAEKLHRELKDKIKAEERSEAESIESSMPELVAILAGKLLASEEISESDELIRECLDSSKT